MKEKIIEFGTKHNVTVEKASKHLIVVIAEDIKEGFLLVGHGMETLPQTGDKGTIVFRHGGVKGGYWQYSPISDNDKQKQ